MKYQEARGHGIENFMIRMKARLDDFEIIIREMENFLWMHRIGVHLEQFYSRARADALAGKSSYMVKENERSFT